MRGNFSAVILTIALAQRAQCLICNGDFEAYSIPSGSEAVGVSPNYTCWYERSGGQFEVQKRFGTSMTKVAELAYSTPNVLCQNVTTLVVGNMYQLNFSVYNHINMNFSEIRVLLNNKSAFNHTTPSQNTFSNASYIFTADSTNTQICFDFFLDASWNSPSTGPCLDNVTLELFTPVFTPTNSSAILCNGDFEAYSIPAGSEYTSVLPNYSCWYNRNGGLFEVQRKLNLNTTKVAELAYYYPYVLCQNVSLVVGGMYKLNFTVFNQLNMTTSQIRLLVNNESVLNQTTLGQYNRSNTSYIFTAASNNTQICFDFFLNVTWVKYDVGPCLDNITLQLIYALPLNTTNTTNANSTNNSTTNSSLNSTANSTDNSTLNSTANSTDNSTLNSTANSTTILASNFTQTFDSTINTTTKQFKLLAYMYQFFLSGILSFPIKLAPALKTAYLLIDDLWLYYYNDKNYTGLIEVLFRTIATIQIMKFDFFERFLGWNKYKNDLKISDYRQYSMQRFVQVEGNSSVLIDSNFAFFIYTILQNILFCGSLCLIFHLLRNYRISKYIRKFCFIKTTLAVALLESSLGYFIFVCLSHLRHSFIFTLADKLSLSFTIIFLFSLFLFSFSFYILIFKYLDKQASYFNEYTYRESLGFWFKTVTLTRNILRPIVFCLLHYDYRNQLILLAVIEMAMLIVSITIQSICQIFISKGMYSLGLIYNFLFVLLNFMLLFQDLVNEESQLFTKLKEIEQGILFCLISNTILMLIRDTVPIDLSKKENKRKPQSNLALVTKKSANLMNQIVSFGVKSLNLQSKVAKKHRENIEVQQVKIGDIFMDQSYGQMAKTTNQEIKFRLS